MAAGIASNARRIYKNVVFWKVLTGNLPNAEHPQKSRYNIRQLVKLLRRVRIIERL